MRIVYRDNQTAKAVARRLSAETGVRLSRCQEALASASGYRDWFELTQIRGDGGLELATLDIEQLAAFIASISTRLSTNPGDIQQALSTSPAIPRSRFGIAQHVQLRAAVFRLTDIPDPGRRKPGAVGKFKNTGESLILREFGRPVHCINDKAADAIVADFEFVSPRVSPPLFIPARLYLAYGVWTEADGAKVLFSRDYMPLWRLREGNRPERVSPVERIKFSDQQWFWEDATAPWSDKRALTKHVQRLEGFGVRGVPMLADLLPTLVFEGRHGGLKSTAEAYFNH